MIVDSMSALLGFLAFLAPGILFELRRERRRPGIQETALREASRIGLISLVITLAALAILAAVRLVRPDWVADFRLWYATGAEYVSSNFRLVVQTLLAQVVLALLLVLLTDAWLSWKRAERARIVSGGLWFQALRQDVPPNCSVWAHVKLVDGTKFWGFVRGYSAEGGVEDREIALEGLMLTQQDPGAAGTEALPASQIGDEWQTVLIHTSQIRYLRVQYRDLKTNELTFSARRARAMERATQTATPADLGRSEKDPP
jgi:hypothetical protein